MTLLSKFGSILRQATSMLVNAQLSISKPGLFQVFRSMSTSPSSKLFVGGISYQTDDQSLREAFSKYGEVIDARVIVDRETGRSRGFGFVGYTSTEDASSAMQALDGRELHGRQVKVAYAAERPPRNFGGGGFNSSYGGSGYGGGGGDYASNNGFFSGNYGANAGYGNTGGGGSGYGGQGNYGGGNNYGSGGVTYGSSFDQSGNGFVTGASAGHGGDGMGFAGGEDGFTVETGGDHEGNDALTENTRNEEFDFAKRA
ncbi:Glycine-rich RNA-binding protein 3 [Hibiscus syriacus]|uniref:Glycine-rich RNA-binding protein 3 n=1 Tax=Hibiscus syriacus TaxID=106335 RepID=A0A6A2ZRM2_HIBSY|nr:glycine-rich RNA-binding protein 3, mitochondrial-like [Hibiscus syriacus]XP_039011607.1 glycine-rich RNA-binding protein 3, mitochondrial-like [Hibiscus syriacus]KAE8693949.1 Glycine-rich RNA-binding protein 3 [Hibiscus syriacus]